MVRTGSGEEEDGEQPGTEDKVTARAGTVTPSTTGQGMDQGSCALHDPGRFCAPSLCFSLSTRIVYPHLWSSKPFLVGC
ncbi:hypothetical protein D4740_03590 [Actinomyces sp. 2119]|nr:hypothetical protein D4740_03590 [Actinomyces sp. 2119]